MSNETTKRLTPLLRKLRVRLGDVPHRTIDESAGEPVLCALVRSLLAWNAGEAAAEAAFARLRAMFVDFNELRVCTIEELGAALAEHPGGVDIAARVRACLGDVYRREHAMSLAALREAPKREARHYLESLDGVPRAAASRVAQEMLDVHAVPVDDRLRGLLEQEGVIDEGTSADHAAVELERAISSNEAKGAVALLLAWADADGASIRIAKAGEAKAKVAKAGAKSAGAKSAEATPPKAERAPKAKEPAKARGVARGAKASKQTKTGGKASSPRGKNAKK